MKKEVSSLHHTYLVHFLVIYIPRAYKVLFIFILKGVELAVSNMQKWVIPGQRK